MTFLMIFAAALLSASPLEGSVEIRFTFETGVETGAIRVALFDSAVAYEDGKPMRGATVDVAAGEREAVFANLPAGDYAMRAFHDVDGDGRMSTNPFGVPIEPFAFSNNAPANMGPPRWDAARFAADGAVAQTISLRGERP